MFRVALSVPFFALLLGTPTAAQDPKTPVPEKTVQDKLTKELKDLFKPEYSKRDSESRKTFAKKLLSDAAGIDNVDLSATAVPIPEPSNGIILAMSGLASVVLRRRRRN